MKACDLSSEISVLSMAAPGYAGRAVEPFSKMHTPRFQGT
jgi:hypothetical protein